MTGSLGDLGGLISESVAAAVVVYDKFGCITRTNSFFESLTGFSHLDLAEGALLESLLPDSEDVSRFHRALQMAILGEECNFHAKLAHRHGFTVWVEGRVAPLDEDHIVAILIDVTEQKRRELLIEEQRKELADVTAFISHDLKAPLFTIRGLAEALREDFHDSLGAEGRKLLKYIEDSANRLESLAKGIIEFSSIANVKEKPDTVKVTEIISEVQQDLAEQFKQSGGILTLMSNLPTVIATRIQLYRLFSNLISNALKYRHSDRAPRIVISFEKSLNENFSTIVVADNGLGIPANKLECLFQPLVRVHNTQVEGHGLGLASVKKIVQQLEGSITVESEEIEGSEFKIKLPNRILS